MILETNDLVKWRAFCAAVSIEDTKTKPILEIEPNLQYIAASPGMLQYTSFIVKKKCNLALRER